MALAHLILMWAPGGQKMTSLLKRCHVGSNEEEEGAMFERGRRAKKASKNASLYTGAKESLAQARIR